METFYCSRHGLGLYSRVFGELRGRADRRDAFLGKHDHANRGDNRNSGKRIDHQLRTDVPKSAATDLLTNSSADKSGWNASQPLLDLYGRHRYKGDYP